MKSIILSNLKSLEQTKSILSELSDEQLRNNSIEPYNSSVGSHLRHILDFYDCIFKCENDIIDLTDRKRDSELESSVEKLTHYLDSVIERLQKYNNEGHRKLVVFDDLGLGKTKIEYTYASIFAHANSHTIHHYAIINYILNGLKIYCKNNSFGYNPTTPLKITS